VEAYLSGVSSHENLTPVILALIGVSYQCCTAIGSYVILNPRDGTLIKKQTTTVPPFSGVSVWGSSFPYEVIPETGQVVFYPPTGNNYLVPDDWNICQYNAVQQCGGASNTTCLNPLQAACAAQYDIPQNHFDSILKVELYNGNSITGVLLASYKAQNYDPYTVACVLPLTPQFCKAPPNKDGDFGDAPSLINFGRYRLLGVGEKTGDFVVLDRDTFEEYGRFSRGGWQSSQGFDLFSQYGNNSAAISSGFEVVRVTHAGPGSNSGGFMWGVANDGLNWYGATTNAMNIPYTLQNGSTSVVGSILSFNLDGSIRLELAHPPFSADELAQLPAGFQTASTSNSFRAFWAPMTVANDVLFAPSAGGPLYAVRTWDFKILATLHPNAGSLWSGPAIYGNYIAFGTGYSYSAQWAYQSQNSFQVWSL
jgi:hypothetical protein